MKAEYFSKMAGVARVRACKPGFAAVKYKERYGEWPPFAWSEKLKAEFTADPGWQVLARAKGGAKTARGGRGGVSGDRGQAVRAAGREVAGAAVHEPEETFSDWLGGEGIDREDIPL